MLDEITPMSVTPMDASDINGADDDGDMNSSEDAEQGEEEDHDLHASSHSYDFKSDHSNESSSLRSHEQ